MLGSYSAIRALSIALVALLFVGAPDRGAWEVIAWSLALGHYALGLVYSRRQILAVAGSPRSLGAFAALGLAGVAVFARLPLTVFFGVHHALNEAYMLDRVTEERRRSEVRVLRATGLALHLVLYTFLVRRRPYIAVLDPLVLPALLVAAYVAFGAALWRARGALARREVLDNVAGEVLGVGMAVASLWIDFTVLHVATYHFVFWVLYPLRSLAPIGGAPLRRYVAATVAVTALVLLVSPLGWEALRFSARSYREAFEVLSYVHITLTFALSDANPAWLVAWFRPGSPASRSSMAASPSS